MQMFKIDLKARSHGRYLVWSLAVENDGTTLTIFAHQTAVLEVRNKRILTYNCREQDSEVEVDLGKSGTFP